jgi:hypothetical protein
MMETEDFVSSIGKQADADIVMGLLRTLGIDRRITMTRDDTDVYLNNADAGVSLLFESESYVSAKHKIGFPSDAPVLTAIFLYGPGDDGFSAYTGNLPGGLLFSDSREKAILKLGNSAKFNPDRDSEFWDFPRNVRFFVRYAERRQSIERVQFGILWR